MKMCGAKYMMMLLIKLMLCVKKNLQNMKTFAKR